MFFLTFFPTDKTADTADEVICYSASNKDSNSEVQSLNSFQSDSCDDNGKIHIQRKILQMCQIQSFSDCTKKEKNREPFGISWFPALIYHKR